MIKKVIGRTPNTYFILFAIIVFVAVLTWIIPGGQYDRIESGNQESLVPDSFHYIASKPQGIDKVFLAPIRGFSDAALIIGLILIVGGAFGIFQKTKAVDAAIMEIATAYNKSGLVRILLIPILMTVFSLGGAIFGMSEEIIPFILIFIPLALVLGYDSIVGVAIPFIGAGAGFAGAFLNPFTIGIAQGVAGLPLFSGIAYRVIAWVAVTALAVIFVVLYAAKIKSDPLRSPVYEIDKNRRKKMSLDEIGKTEGLILQHKIVLITFLLGMVILILGVLEFQWYIEEITAIFLVTGIAVGLLGRLKIKEITDAFIAGARDLVGTALVVALARGILVVARDGLIIDTVLHYLSSLIDQFHPVISAQSMMIVQTVINFFIPSGSGQAALTMPIMAPLADLAGVSRQTAVLAFQFGDGFSNMIIPTSAVTMGVLTLADIPWQKWARWILPLQLYFMIIGFLLLIPPFLMDWQ